MQHNISINNHPLASQLPKIRDRPSLFGSPADFAPLIRDGNSPRRLEDWLYSDLPQLSVHIVSFEDATLMTVTFHHTMTDAMGLACIFKAWTAVLRGKEAEVPPFHGFETDPLSSLSETTSSDRFICFNRMLTGINMFLFAARYVFELLWYRNDEYRVIFLPGKYLNHMRETVMQELAAEADGPETPFVSESDVLLAWWIRTTLSALDPAPDRMVQIMNIFDIRSKLTQELPTPDRTFVGNAIFASYTFLRVRQILDERLSFVASQIRSDLIQQRTREQIEASAALQKSVIDRTGHLSLFGQPDQILIACSNWNKGRFFEVDFSAAVIAPGCPVMDRANGLGKASYINTTGENSGMSLRNMGPVIGKDAAGNWWLAWNMHTEAWPVIEKQLELIG
jgi:hypothetical protein